MSYVFSLRFFFGLGLMSALASSLAFGAVPADVGSPVARKKTLALALSLVETAPIGVIPPGIVHPFDPVAFGQPDPEELAAIAAAQAAEAAALNKTKPATEADLLERIADRVVPSGTLTMNNEPLLIFGQRRLRVGDKLTVTYDAKDYTLEITGIQRFTFTLRLNRAEITRRINP